MNIITGKLKRNLNKTKKSNTLNFNNLCKINLENKVNVIHKIGNIERKFFSKEYFNYNFLGKFVFIGFENSCIAIYDFYKSNSSPITELSQQQLELK